MKLISFLLRSASGTVVLAILAGLVAGASNTGLLVLINTNLHRADSATVRLGWYFAALCCLMLSSRLTSVILLIRLSRWSIYSLQIKLCRQIAGVPLRRMEELGAPRMTATLTEDVPVIAMALSSIPSLCMHSTVVATCLLYLCWLSVPVFLGMICFMLLGVLSYRLVLSRGVRHIQESRREFDQVMKHLRALTEGAKELRLHGERRDAFFSTQLEPSARALRYHGYMADTTYGFASGWGQLLIFILIGLLIFELPGLKYVEAETLTGYSLVILYIMTPLEYIMGALPTFSRANVSMRKVEDVGLTLRSRPVEPADAARHALPLPDYHSLELVGVTHAYYREDKGQSFLLGPISLSFRPGELVFLTGGNGSGKTTLAKLLTGLYAPESGEVRFNGRLVTDENRASYQQLFSAVFTDFFLFENLLGLNRHQLDARTRELLVQLQLDHKVEVKDGTLSTTELSQGQRKRLALLTAYLEDRAFYVFDEWAADQDPLFKEVFYSQLLPELKARGKTVLVISHDDRYYHVADRVAKLDYGQIVSPQSQATPARPG